MNQPAMAHPGPSVSDPRIASAFLAWRNCQMMKTTAAATSATKNRAMPACTRESASSRSPTVELPARKSSAAPARLKKNTAARSAHAAATASRMVTAVAKPRSGWSLLCGPRPNVG